jgi:hypothetical protein
VTSRQTTTRNVWLLGPQYHAPFLGTLFPDLGLPDDGPIAAVTSGWQEREGEDTELDKHLGGRSLDLELYRRADHVFRSDPEFTHGHREMQRRLRELTRIYDMRLSFMRDAILWLLEEKGDPVLLEPEREHVVSQVRELDAWQLKRIVEIRGEFEERFRPLERESIAREREEIARILDSAAALVITGGHVAVLLNRLRLFGVPALAEGKEVIAWSAGAMTLTDRVVLFHDHPPQGAGNAGVMEKGFGLCPGIVVLPDGRKRLDLDDPIRVSMMALRFHPDACIVMGDGDVISWNGESWRAKVPATRLSVEGTLETVTQW